MSHILTVNNYYGHQQSIYKFWANVFMLFILPILSINSCILVFLAVVHGSVVLWREKSLYQEPLYRRMWKFHAPRKFCGTSDFYPQPRKAQMQRSTALCLIGLHFCFKNHDACKKGHFGLLDSPPCVWFRASAWVLPSIRTKILENETFEMIW